MKVFYTWMALSLLLWRPTTQAAAYTWDDSSSDHQWSNPTNWTADSGVPGTNDDASFTSSVPGTVLIEDARAVKNLTFNHYSNIVAVQLSGGAELAVSNLNIASGDLSNAVTQVTMTGGTLRVNGTVTVGGHVGAYYSRTDGALSLSNMVVDLSQATVIRIGWNSQVSATYGSVSGLWNLATTTLTFNGTNDLFKVGTSLTIGGVGAGAGILKLPPSMKEMHVPSATFGSAAQASRAPGTNSLPDWWSVLDLGDDPQLKRVVFRDYIRIAKMMTLYRQNGNSLTNRWPPNLEFAIGLSNAPIALLLGDLSQTESDITWKEMKRFEAYLTDLSVGNNTGGSSGNARGELDLAATNTVELIGSITASHVLIPGQLLVGAGNRPARGILRLPHTVTNVTAGDITLGAYHNDNPPENLSLIDLGSDPQLITLTATNDLSIGHGLFLYTDSGLSKTGLPAGTELVVGLSPDRRASLKYAHMQKAFTVDLGPDIRRFSAYLKEFRIGSLTGGSGSRIITGRLDLRKAVLDPFDVDGHFIVAMTPNNKGYVYLPPGRVSVSSNLLMGLGYSISYPSTALISLSNTAFHVGGAVRLGTNTTVQCSLAGQPCGLDFEVGTNLIFEAANARMEVAFLADPLDPTQPYWGLKLRNTNAVALLQAWTSAPARVTYSTSGLSDKAREQFGIHYDAGGNFTYLGVMKRSKSSVFHVR